MIHFPQKNFWPYDELTFLREDSSSATFKLQAPWLTLKFEVDDVDIERAVNLSNKMSAQSLGPEDLSDINWLLNSFASYPFAYILPSAEQAGSDQHAVVGSSLNMQSPVEALLDITKNSLVKNEIKNVILNYMPQEWTWDLDASLAFSKIQDGYDAESIFSICRRFHLLNDLENNKTAEMFALIKKSTSTKEVFAQQSALVMRQNHYITQKCEWVLNAAFDLAQNAKSEVEEFVSAEKGHDKILDKALSSMGFKAEEVKALSSTVVLMELFYLIAKKNFLAFSMVVDIFERTSYLEEDPFATVLTEGGQTSAAAKIETHREINDMGGHENVAIEFLSNMKAVDAVYATEAVRLAELLTIIIHFVSRETIDEINAN